MTSWRCFGGKRPGASRSRLVAQPGQAVLCEPPPPQDRGGAIAADLSPDGRIAKSLGSKQNNAAAQDHPLRRSQLTGRLLKVLTVGFGEGNGNGSWTRHRSLPKQDDLPIPQASRNPFFQLFIYLLGKTLECIKLHNIT